MKQYNFMATNEEKFIRKAREKRGESGKANI